MVWGVGSLHRIEGTMNQYTYKDILEKNLLETIENMPDCDVVFQHNNGSGHCAKSVKNWLQTQPFQTHGMAQSPNINPIENV